MSHNLINKQNQDAHSPWHIELWKYSTKVYRYMQKKKKNLLYIGFLKRALSSKQFFLKYLSTNYMFLMSVSGKIDVNKLYYWHLVFYFHLPTIVPINNNSSNVTRAPEKTKSIKVLQSKSHQNHHFIGWKTLDSQTHIEHINVVIAHCI